MINIIEHSSRTYAPRTKLNAKLGDITVAFYVDDTTAGERLTKSAAGKKYIGIPIGRTPAVVAKTLYDFMYARNAWSINIAGNGIYTLDKFAITQYDVNLYVTSIINILNQNRPIQEIYSGGQTGVDLAGIVAAKYLGINAIMTMPKGYIQRFEDGRDVGHTKEDIEQQIDYWVDRL